LVRLELTLFNMLGKRYELNWKLSAFSNLQKITSW